MLARMDVWLDFARWAYDFRLQVWGVIGAALLLAWLQRNAKARELKNYDAWWLHYAQRNRKRRDAWNIYRSSPRKRG